MRKYEPDERVRVEFREDRTGESEWMWVKVDYCEDENNVVFGWLDNIPVLNTDLTLSQHPAISCENMREHRKLWRWPTPRIELPRNG